MWRVMGGAPRAAGAGWAAGRLGWRRPAGAAAAAAGVAARAARGPRRGVRGGRCWASQAPAEGPCEGVVLSAQANYVRVLVPALGGSSGRTGDDRAGQRELLCVARGVLRKTEQRVRVGDRVRVCSVDWVDGRALVESILPRTSFLTAPPVANVDHILLMFALEQPPLEPENMTKFLVTAEASGLPVSLGLNKADLVERARQEELRAQFRAWGYESLMFSTHTGQGIGEVQAALAGRTTVVAGPSGVGKSSLIQSLRRGGEDGGGGADFTERAWEDLRTQEVGRRSGRGRHTTRHISLLEIPGGGRLVDTPGFNQPNLKELTTATLPQCFPEIRAQLGGGDGIAGPGPQCQFSNCRHLEEPGCVVHAEWERYPMYVQMNFEVEQHETAARRAGAGKQRRESRTKRKAGRSGRGARVEPKLELKKHRRVSRKRSKQGQLKDWETGGGRAWDEL